MPWGGKLKTPDPTEEQLELAEEMIYKSWHYPYEQEPIRIYEAYQEWESEARRRGKIPVTPLSEIQMVWTEVVDPLGSGMQFECVVTGMICPTVNALEKRDQEKILKNLRNTGEISE